MKTLGWQAVCLLSCLMVCGTASVIYWDYQQKEAERIEVERKQNDLIAEQTEFIKFQTERVDEAARAAGLAALRAEARMMMELEAMREANGIAKSAAQDARLRSAMLLPPVLSLPEPQHDYMKDLNDYELIRSLNSIGQELRTKNQQDQWKELNRRW